MNPLSIYERYYGESIVQKYNSLKKLYDDVSNGVKKKKSILNQELLEKCGLIEQEVELCQTARKCQEIYHQRWRCVQKSLDLVKRRTSNPKYKNYANVVIGDEGVVYMAAQLLVSGHSSAIPIENIYSTCYKRKKCVWKTIQKRFGEQCQLIYVTSLNPFHFARRLGIPVWQVRANDSIQFLYDAQQNHLCK